MIAEATITCPTCGASIVGTISDGSPGVFLRMHRLQRAATARAGRLLRVLFLRNGSSPVDADVGR